MNWPVQHSVHILEAMLELYDPGIHVLQYVNPVPVEYMPVTHDWHELAPVETG